MESLRHQPVLVTGGSGHLGSALIQELLTNGYKVRATTRNLSKLPYKLSHSRQNLEFVQCDVGDFDQLKSTMTGCCGVFHLAAPTTLWAKNPKADIEDPIIFGIKNILNAANDLKIKRIIYTSSCAAIGMDSPSDRPFNETDWNDDAITSYPKAKTQAEKWGFEFSKKHNLQFISICPPSIIGPGMHSHTPSTEPFERLLRGKLPVLPPLAFHYVDVRDVANAHLNAFENPEAKGRYIVAGEFMNMDEMGQLMEKSEPGLRAPKIAPIWALKAYTGIDWLLHKFANRPREITLDIIEEGVGKHQHLSTNKAVQQLNWNPRPLEESVKDTFKWIKDHFINTSIG